MTQITKTSWLAAAALVAMPLSVFANESAHKSADMPADSSMQQAGKAGTSGDQMSIDQLRKAETLNHLHHVNQKEVQMAKMGQEKAESQKVKDIAGKIITDHEKADKRVSDVAKTENVELRNFQASTYEQATMDSLGKLSGAQFDRAFMDVMHRGHQWTLDTLSSLEKSVKDPEVKALIREHQPTIRQHRQAARDIKLKTDQAGTAGQAGKTSDAASSSRGGTKDQAAGTADEAGTVVDESNEVPSEEFPQGTLDNSVQN